MSAAITSGRELLHQLHDSAIHGTSAINAIIASYAIATPQHITAVTISIKEGSTHVTSLYVTGTSRFVPTAGSWRSLPKITRRLVQARGVVHHQPTSTNGTIYVTDASGDLLSLPVNATTPIGDDDDDDQPWREHKSCPVPRAQATTIVIGDHLYAIGGTVDGITDAAIVGGSNAFDLVAHTWLPSLPIALPSLPSVRHSSTAIVCNNILYLVGGIDADGKTLDTITFAPLTGHATAWSTITLPAARHTVSLIDILHDGRTIGIIGGARDSSTDGCTDGWLLDTRSHILTPVNWNSPAACSIQQLLDGTLVAAGVTAGQHKKSDIHSFAWSPSYVTHTETGAITGIRGGVPLWTELSRGSVPRASEAFVTILT